VKVVKGGTDTRISLDAAMKNFLIQIVHRYLRCRYELDVSMTGVSVFATLGNQDKY